MKFPPEFIENPTRVNTTDFQLLEQFINKFILAMIHIIPSNPSQEFVTTCMVKVLMFTAEQKPGQSFADFPIIKVPTSYLPTKPIKTSMHLILNTS